MFQQFGIEPENTERPTNVYVRKILSQYSQMKRNGMEHIEMKPTRTTRLAIY